MWRPEASSKNPLPKVVDDLVVDPDHIDESKWQEISDKAQSVSELTFQATLDHR